MRLQEDNFRQQMFLSCGSLGNQLQATIGRMKYQQGEIACADLDRKVEREKLDRIGLNLSRLICRVIG